jgi:hypothetical protein
MSELNMEPITLEKSNLIINSAIEKGKRDKNKPYNGGCLRSPWSN